MSKINNHDVRPIVGIDLGTTNSAVAYINRGKPEIIPSPGGDRIIPSVVLIDLKNNIMVGEDARSALIAMPDRTVAAVKRKMGSPNPIPIAGQQLLPQEISALILKELKTYVDAKFGAGEKEAVITVPAYFTDEQRRATKQAGELAGFVVERIINEPTAAAMAFGLNHLKEDQHVLVYDLGGGTFDVSAVEMMSGIIEVKATSGNNNLGGEDFDWRIVDWLADKIKLEQQIAPRLDIRARALLKEEAEKIKIKLSTTERVDISLPLVTVKDGQPVGLFTTFTRAQFIALIEHYLMETMDCVRRVMADAGLKPEDIHQILLVGGSTRIPRVRELIRDYFNQEPRADVHPDEAVALGAAVQAGIKSGTLAKKGLILTDVAPFSMGIAVLKEWKNSTIRPGGYHVIIPRNTTIPVNRTENFYTAADGQTTAAIEIYQGENQWVKQNHRLGEFLLEGIPLNRAGAETIEVTYKYDINGILEVTARCASNGKEMSVSVHDSLNRDSREAFDESVARLDELYIEAGVEEADRDENEDWETAYDLNIDDEDMADWMDEYGLGDEPGEELNTWEELLAEGRNLLNKARQLQDQGTLKRRKKLPRVIHDLQKAIMAGDENNLRSAIDEALDLFIDLEMELS